MFHPDKPRSGSRPKYTDGKGALMKKTESEVRGTPEEIATLANLKNLYLETIKIDVEMQMEIYYLEKRFEEKHNVIFDKRRKVIEDFRKIYKQDADKYIAQLDGFWLKVLKASYTEFISKSDEKILHYLVDIRARMISDPEVKFTLEFFFEPNPYFNNSSLVKTYFLNCAPDPEDPITYDGAEIYKCEGCEIDWKPEHADKKFENLSMMPFPSYSSFFDFFEPPKLPDDIHENTYASINSMLQNDFELGFYLKERVIPKAVLFFTGEIADCQSTDDEDEEEDSDADAEDDLENEEEDEDTIDEDNIDEED